MDRIENMEIEAHLIIDIGTEGIFALFISKNGEITPCAQTVMDRPIEFFWGDALWVGKESKNNQEQIINDLLDDDWQLKKGRLLRYFPLDTPDVSLLPIRHPVNLLGDSSISQDENLKKSINTIACRILQFLLEPVFNCVERGEKRERMSVVIVAPDDLDQNAKTILRGLLNEQGFAGCMFLNRATAAAMHLLKNSFSNQAATLEIGKESSHISHIDFDYTGNTAKITISKTETIENFGWDTVVLNVTQALNNTDNYSNRRAVHELEVDRALKAAIWGIPEYNTINDTASRENELDTDEFLKLMHRIQDMQAEEKIIIPYGLALSYPQLEKKLLPFDEDSLSSQSTSLPPFERPARGIAEMLHWLNLSPENNIQIVHSGSLRLITMDNTSIELIPFKSLPHIPEEEITIKQRFEIPEKLPPEQPNITIALQWGTNRNPYYNINLLQITFQPGEEQIPNGGIEIAIKLQKHKQEPDIGGNVSVKMGKTHKNRNIRLPRFSTELNQNSLKQTKSLEVK